MSEACSLSYSRTLFYYDGPQLILATDSTGAWYLCMLAAQTDKMDKFVCAAISSTRLSEFEDGAFDLLQVFKEPETGELYEGDAEYSADDFSLAAKPAQRIPECWYPEAGFFLGLGENRETGEG